MFFFFPIANQSVGRPEWPKNTCIEIAVDARCPENGSTRSDAAMFDLIHFWKIKNSADRLKIAKKEIKEIKAGEQRLKLSA